MPPGHFIRRQHVLMPSQSRMPAAFRASMSLGAPRHRFPAHPHFAIRIAWLWQESFNPREFMCGFAHVFVKASKLSLVWSQLTRQHYFVAGHVPVCAFFEYVINRLKSLT